MPFPNAPDPATTAAMLLIAAYAGWHDWHSWRIPNRLLAGSAAAALMLALFWHDGIGLTAALAGAGLGLVLLLPFHAAGGVAAGDVKLLAVLGLFAGPSLLLHIAVTSFLLGGLWASAVLWLQTVPGQRVLAWLRTWRVIPDSGRLRKSDAPLLYAGSRGSIPYGAVVAVGTFIAVALNKLS